MTIEEQKKVINENLGKIYDAGYEKGKAEGSDRVFWNKYLQNGKRENYGYAFAGEGWTDETFKPNHDMVVKNAGYLFHSTKIGNLKALLEAQGVTMDFSQCALFTYAFGMSQLTDIGAVDVRSSSGSVQYFLYYSQKVRTFEKLIVDENVAFTNTAFQFASALEEIRFEGLLGQNGLDFQWSKKLSKDSITSIINALSPTATGKTVTLSKTAVENAFPDTPIEITPFNDSPSSVFTNNGDGSITLNEIPSENTTYTLKDDLVLPKGSYRMMWTEGHCDWDYANVFVTLRVNGEVVSGGDTIYASEDFVFNITDDEAVVSLSVTARPGLGWSGEPLKITPVISPDPDWETLVATKPNWTISLV